MAVDGAEIAKRVQNYLGVKYVYGGNSLTSGIDCSALVQQVYAQFGVKVARTTYDQINQGKAVDLRGLEAGDMVFFDTDRSVNGPDHVGIYIGGGKFVHAPRPGKSVEISNLMDGYYSGRFMGGRRVQGIIGGGQGDLSGGGSYGSAESQPRLSAEELAANYGWAYGFLTSQPELKGIFEQAVAENWQAPKFKAALENTNWWKNTSQKAREAQVLQATDPATFSAQVNAMTMKVRQVANEIGAILPEGMMSKIGEDALRFGMEDAELQYTLAKYIDFTKEGTLGGQAGMAEIRLRQLARANGVDISNQTIKNYAQGIAMGTASMEEAEASVRNMAKSMFPTYAEQIDGGANMMDVASPYMQLAANELEIAPSQMDLFNPIVKQGLNGLNTDGQPHGMSITDFQNYVRSQPQWMQTKGAREQINKVGADVLKSMGLI